MPSAAMKKTAPTNLVKSKNPLLKAWTTPFEVPPFGEIAPEHFLPAFESALEKHRAEIDKIAAADSKPTFKNTIVALENAGRLLGRVGAAFWNLTGAHTNEALQAIERVMSPKLAAHWTAIAGNAAIFARVDDLHRRRDDLKLAAEEKRLLERTHLELVRAGAKLSKKAKKRHAEIVERLAVLGTRFSQNVLADEKAYELPLQAAARRMKPADLGWVKVGAET